MRKVLIPKYWARSRQAPGGKDDCLLLQTWGWSDASLATALDHAERRLQALLQRVQDARDLRHAGAYYTNGERPLREEVLEASPGGADDGEAIVTRNRYGAAILNTSSLLFLDIDLPAPQRRGLFAWFARPRPAPQSPEARLDRLKSDLVAHSTASFRLYRTARGFRALAVDRSFDPVGDEACGLMQAVGADPMFLRLCRGQKSFRARLTPKPWRCGVPNPPDAYPRSSAGAQAFSAWLQTYSATARQFATCRYLETLGGSPALGKFASLIEYHDAHTQAAEPLPLA